MRVFVAGATGAIGKQLVPRLVAAGYEVHGMTRSGSKQAMLDELGAVPVLADALDPDQVAEAVGRVRPEVIVHQLTRDSSDVGPASLRSRFRADQPSADRGHGLSAVGRARGRDWVAAEASQLAAGVRGALRGAHSGAARIRGGGSRMTHAACIRRAWMASGGQA
jgi:uncharacterized protein YbjT (DUF2867 family)